MLAIAYFVLLVLLVLFLIAIPLALVLMGLSELVRAVSSSVRRFLFNYAMEGVTCDRIIPRRDQTSI